MIKKRIRQLREDLSYLFLNYIVSNIPCWHIRKIFYLLFGMKIGKGARIHMKTIVLCPKRIEVGDRTIINEHCFIDGRGYLKIGQDVSISVFSMILTGSHDKSSAEFAYKPGKVTIENNVWLGSRAIVLDNSNVKQSSIIGAGSVFKGTSEENAVYVGVPAKKIGNRELEDVYQLTYKPFFR